MGKIGRYWNSLLDTSKLNLDAHWMPFTASRAFKASPRMIVGGDGHYFETDDGRRVFDSLSGLWCTGAGHNIASINAAVTAQLSKLDFAPSFQFGHPLSFQLAERLGELMPGKLNRVFFTNSGSETADTSLKIARAYWRAVGRPAKTKLIGRAKGYHGVNFGGMSLGGIGPNRKQFGLGVEADHLPSTLLPENAFSQGMPQYGEHLANYLEHIVAVNDASNIAAVLVEPMSGSGGVVVPPQGYLERLREICTQHEILLIFDEVITGLGRSGAATAAEKLNVIPDIINLAKQLTNGLIPMGAVMLREDIHAAFMTDELPAHGIELPHGYTYSAHPIAAAAAMATLDHLQERDLFAQANDRAALLQRLIHELKGTRNVIDIRNFGLAGAIQLAPRDGDPTVRPYEAGIALWQKDNYVRWGGDTLQFGPPFDSTDAELEQLFAQVGDVLESID
jgi:beta-alanine--pyruvate transaminase